MSRFDLVIFGATGFTGKKAVEEISRVAKKYGDITWAVAGRSQSKLEAMISETSKKTGQDLSAAKVIVADVGDEPSLKAMCGQARVLLNCCGPYRFHGEAVVRAAVAARAHYVDVSGEPQFMEKMQLHYDAQAREAGVYVVSACGLDSVPNDMGVVFLQNSFDGTINSIESYLSASLPREHYAAAAQSGVIHYATWESLVYSLANMSELGPLRKKLYPERLPTFKPKLKPRSLIHKRGAGWCLPFPGADLSVVYRTQRYFYEQEHKRPIQFRPYVQFTGLAYTIFAIISGALLYLMSKTWPTRKLLLAYPRVFSFGVVSHSGPQEEVMNNTQFTVDLIASGWSKGKDVETEQPDKSLAARVSGVNPGYGATVTALVFCAIAALQQSDRMPGNGGVLTTGVAFRDTDLLKNLNDNNFKFKLVDNIVT